MEAWRRRWPAWVAGLATAVALLAASAALADPPHRSRAATPRAPRAPQSRSVGFPWDGRLEHGVELVDSAHVRRLGEYAPGGRFFGTAELVGLLERAAAAVARRFPGARLGVGELSRRGGGDIDGHGSHENGRDADLAFYMLDARGRPYEPFAFAEFDADGKGVPPNQMLRFDDARNWELVARLVSDPAVRVQYIFVGDAIRRRLLAEGRRRGASPRVLERAETLLMQPGRGHPHRNHFHIRVYCDPSDRPRCLDREPYWPWYPGTPPGPVTPVRRGR